MTLDRASARPFALVLAAACLLLSGCAVVPEDRQAPIDNVERFGEVTDLSDMAQDIESLASEDPRAKILVVLDIDDTLLESTQFFGGDAWYRWQRGRAVPDGSDGTVVIDDDDTTRCIFAKLAVLFELARFEPTQEDASEIVRALASSHDVVALTSRSPAARSGTERELARAGLALDASHLLDSGIGFDYDFDDGNREARVTYSNGVIMSSGLDKGRVLRDFLDRADRRYDAIFMIDDGERNLDNIEREWRDDPVRIALYHYTRVDKSVSESDIERALSADASLDAFVRNAFPDRYNEFAADQCN